MSRTFDKSTAWIVNRPYLSVLLILILSAIAIVGYRSPKLFEDLFGSTAFVEDEQSSDSDLTEEEIQSVPNVNPMSLRSDAIIVCQSKEFFSPRGAEAMRHVVKELEALDEVAYVMWMDRVPILNIFGLPEPLFPRSTSSQSRFDSARRKAQNHPLVNGQLLSEDGNTLLLMVSFDFIFVDEDRDCMDGLREAAEKAASAYPGFQVEFFVTGDVPTFLTALETHESNQLKYQIIAYSMIFIMSLILFRGFSAVIIVALAPVVGVFWTMGFVSFLDINNNPFKDVVLPVLISLVGFTDGVHLMVQIRRNRASGMQPGEAARKGIQQVGLACFLTSLTTAIGFGSLSLAHHEIVREFGYSCVVGVLLTFVAVITCIPLACSSWLGKSVHQGLEKSLIDKNLGRISGLIDFVLKRTGWMSKLGIGITLVLFLVSMTLQPDERQANVLPLNSEAAIGLQKMDQSMGGIEVSNVEIKWSREIQADSTEVLEVIREVDQLLESEPLIGHPLSIRNLLDALPGDGADDDRMSMLDLLPPPLKRAFFTPEWRRALVNFRVQDLGIAAYGPVFTRIETKLDEIMEEHPEFSVEMSGQAVWRWRNLYQIVVDLAWSLGTASIIIFLVLALVYRSLRIGLISIIPNVFPLAVAGSYLVVSGQSLEIVSVCAFTVCLGIAVDDTIHFLTRYLEEKRESKDERQAIRRAFIGVGTALIMTTVVLVCGFLTVLFSNSHDHRVFASMGAITVASALFGDLVFLPAILERYAPKAKSD